MGAPLPRDQGSAADSRATFVLALALSIAAGCSPSRDTPPVPDSTMVNVIIELHLAAARAEAEQDVPDGITDSILVAYDLDSTTYAEAVNYYAEHPEKYGEIYSRVLDRLNSERMPLGPIPETDDVSRPPVPRTPR